MSNGLRQEDSLRRLLEKDAVVSTVNRLFRSVDEKNWEGAESCLAPRVLLDVSSVDGSEPAHTTGAAIVEGWREALTPIEKVHHQAGNYEVEVRGEEANASCYGIAYHYLSNESGRNTRVFVGTYAMRLRKSGGAWRIYRFRYDLKFVDGNVDLEGNG